MYDQREFLQNVPTSPLLSTKKNQVNNSLHLYEVKKFHSLRSEFHSILTPVEWKFTTQRGESRSVHSMFTPKEVITDVTTQGVRSVTNRVKIHFIFREYILPTWTKLMALEVVFTVIMEYMIFLSRQRIRFRL